MGGYTVPDWAAIKADFIAGGISYRELAKKHGVNYMAVYKHAKAEDWETVRETVRKKAEKRIIQQTAKSESERVLQINRIGNKLLNRLELLVDSMPQDMGTAQMKSITQGTVNKGEGQKRKEQFYSLRDIANVYKTVSEVVIANAAPDKADDPLMMMLERLDNEANSE